MAAGTRRVEAQLRNVVAWLPGTDPARRGECVVVGAHLDHVGVGPRGRIGFGADDNASGVAALLVTHDRFGLGIPLDHSIQPGRDRGKIRGLGGVERHQRCVGIARAAGSRGDCCKRCSRNAQQGRASGGSGRLHEAPP